MMAPLAQISLLTLLDHLQSILANAGVIGLIEGDVMGGGRCLVLVLDFALRPSQDLITVATLVAGLGDLSFVCLAFDLSGRLLILL